MPKNSIIAPLYGDTIPIDLNNAIWNCVEQLVTIPRGERGWVRYEDQCFSSSFSWGQTQAESTKTRCQFVFHVKGAAFFRNIETLNNWGEVAVIVANYLMKEWLNGESVSCNPRPQGFDVYWFQEGRDGWRD